MPEGLDLSQVYAGLLAEDNAARNLQVSVPQAGQEPGPALKKAGRL